MKRALKSVPNLGARLSSLRIVVGLAMAWTPGAVRAEPGLLLADARPAESEALAAGDQLLLEDRSGPFAFAGHQLDLDGFTGIVGYASEVAYVVVLDGAVRDGDRRVGPGRMLLIPPFGAAPDVQRFDAARVAASWSAPFRAARPQVAERMASIARGQQRGIFLGRLGTTRFNVATSGQPGRELARRALLGSETIRSIRFAGVGDAAAIDRQVVETFAAGLRSGDAERVASLMDPSPFGGRSLAGGAVEARLVAARGLIASRDWNALLGSEAARAESGVWRLGTAALTLRRIDDFVFIQRIEGEAQ
jgi:hypothetical protein